MANKVPGTPSLPQIGNDALDSLRALHKALFQMLIVDFYRTNLCLPNDGTERMEAPLPLARYTTVLLPSAALYPGALVYDTTTSTVKFSNGAVWANV